MLCLGVKFPESQSWFELKILLTTFVIVPYVNRIHPRSLLQIVQLQKSSLDPSCRFPPLINRSNQLPTRERVPNPRRKQKLRQKRRRFWDRPLFNARREGVIGGFWLCHSTTQLISLG